MTKTPLNSRMSYRVPIFPVNGPDYSKKKHRAKRRKGFAMKGGRSKAETKKADSKLSVKKGAAAASKSTKKGKPAKDPNKPKRPASAFFVFMEEFRKTYKEKHPNNKSVAAVGKAGGDKWKSLSAAEKAPYVTKAEKRKVDYEKELRAYNKKLAEGPAEEESEKSNSEVNDEDDEEGSGEEDDDEDDDEDDE
ncbi:Hypothetical predicted protein [Olea europaea subsp. europaea]|uniref:HMG box domain-containing protein n=1 Tax=Olea europaea subsp. europaea TaxID=158383 RepID=A0A8S0SCB7_OLEEU|nr:Hypothetical predicted protein [Olea europaea subsp. europaea]